MSSTNIEKRMRYLQSSRNGNRLSLSTSVSKEKLQKLSELRHKNSQMRSVPAAGRAVALASKNTEVENDGSVVRTPSSSVSNKNDKVVDKSGTTKAFEGARNHISELVNNATKAKSENNVKNSNTPIKTDTVPQNEPHFSSGDKATVVKKPSKIGMYYNDAITGLNGAWYRLLQTADFVNSKSPKTMLTKLADDKVGDNKYLKTALNIVSNINNPQDKVIKTLKSVYERETKAGQQRSAEAHYMTPGHMDDDIGETVSSLAGMLPQTIVALLSGGASEGATVADYGTKAVSDIIQQGIIENPSFWYSFSMTAGPEYEKAKEKGATEAQATTAAWEIGVINALIEIGGGLEAPNASKKGLWNHIKENGLGEAKEEVLQGGTENLIEKIVYDPSKPWFSTTDEDAVINPNRAFKEGKGGLIGGLFWGSAMKGINSGVNLYNNTAYNSQTSKAVKAYANTVQSTIDKANTAIIEVAKQSDVKSFNLPTAPNWKKTTVAAINNYINETVKKYNELLNDEKVTGENKETIRQTLKDMGVDGEIEVKAESVSDNDLLNEEVQKRFADNVDKVFRGELPRERVIEIGHTPRLLQEYGAGDLPMSITQNTMYKIAYPTGYFGAEDGGHNLGIPALKQLPSQIAEPTAILKSNSQSDSLVLLTEWKDAKGNPVIVPLHLDKNGILGMTNEVASAYGKKDMTPLLIDSNGDSTVLYTKNNEDIHQLLQAGLQLPSVVADDTLVNNSISQNEQNVNNEVNTNIGNTWQASQLTPSIARYMNGLTGAPSDMSGIETANNTVRSGEYNVFDRDFVNGYADGFVQGMAERNSNAYRNLSQSTDNLSGELASYVLTGQSSLANNNFFRIAAQNFENVLTDAVNKNAIVHSTSYGNDTRLAQQAEAVRNGDFSVMNVGELQNADTYSDADPIRGLIQDEFSDILAESERNAIDSLATAIGRTVKIVPTIGNGKADGCRIGDVLYIAANANDKFTYVFAHELTHSLEGTNGYANYSDAILDRLAREENVSVDELVSRKIAEYAEGGITLDDTGARQELVADFTKNILTDENKAMEFVNSIENAQQRRTVIQWLRDSIRNLINRIRGNFNADVARLNDLERISNMFEGMLKEAANDNTVQTDGETQFLFAGKNAKTANVGTLAQAKGMKAEDMTAGERQAKSPESMRERNGVVFAEGNGESYSSVDLSNDNILSEMIKNKKGSEKYKIIRDYILNVLSEQPVTLSDGIEAVVDKSDALHLANKSWNAKTAYISKIRQLIEEAKLYAVDDGVQHNKFDGFRYYRVDIKLNNESYPIYLNVGRAKNNTGYHIYDITKKIRGTAKQNALERVDNDLRSEISPLNNIISENEPIVKNSLAENTGNQTKTDSFKNWFGDWENDPDNSSKVVNEDGTPKVVYHGTNADFNIFDLSKSGSNFPDIAEGWHFFTSYKNAYPNSATDYARNAVSQNGGNEVVKEVYLDIKKPLRLDSKGYYSTNEYFDRNADEIYDKYFNGDYDGVIIENSDKNADDAVLYLVDNSSRIKSATDNIGTFDPNNADIRFATRDNSDTANNANAASALMKKYNANGRGLYVKDVRDAIYALAGEIHDISYSEETFPKIEAHAQGITRMILDNARVVDESAKEEYNHVRDFMKGKKIKITDELKSSIPDWNDFRKSTMGTLVLANNGTPVDVIYKELAEEFPQHFDEQEYVTQSDQLYHIFDTMRSLKPQESTLSETEYDAAFEELTGDILSRVINMAENYKPRKVKEASQYEDADWNDLAHSDIAWQEWDKQRQEKDRDRQRYNKKIQQIQEKANERIKRAAEIRKESEDRTKLLNISRRLNNMKLSPENKARIPDIVYEIDTVSKGILKEGYTTVDGREIMGELDLRKLRDDYLKIKETDPDFIPNKDIESRIVRLDKRQIADMDIADVRELVQTLQQVEHEIRTNNKMLRDAQNREIAQVADDCIKELRKTKGLSEKHLTKTFSWIERQWMRQVNPEQFFKRTVGYQKDSTFVGLGKALDDGQTKSLVFKQKSSERFNHLIQQKENMKKFTGKDAEWIDISEYSPEGEKLYITQEMRTALSLQSKNYANLRHIKYGGITIPNRFLYEQGNFVEAYKHGTIVKLTPSQVQRITAKMTSFEREFAEAAYKFFNDDCKKAINETSLTLNGYEKATVKDYFPIVGNEAFVGGEFESLSRNGTLEGKGILQERQYASNPIVLEALTKVIVRHSDDVAAYYGLAIPIRNFNKVYNSKGKNYSHSFKDEFNHKWSDNEAQYIENLMADLQGARSGTGSKTVAWLNSNYAKATLTLNLGVMLQQSGSYPTAAAELGYKALAKAFSENMTDEDFEIINKYTPYYYIRQQGYTTSEIGDYVNGNSEDWTKQGKMPLIMGGIQRVDLATTAKLWKATEFYIRDNYKDLKVGSDEYYRKVAEKYETVLKRTQPMYTTMQRSDLLRETDSVIKATTMFRSQPSQNHNLIYDASKEFQARYLDYKQNPNETTRADFVEARKRLVWTLSSQIIQAMVVTVCRAVGYALRGDLKKHYLGEKGDKKWWEQFLIDGGSLISGNLWFSSHLFDAVMAIEGMFEGRNDTVYDIEAPSLAMFNDVVTGTLGLAKDVIQGKKGAWGIIKRANKLLTDVLQMFTGTPIKNAEKYVKGIYSDVVGIHNFLSEKDWPNYFDLADEMSGNTHGIPMKKWGEYIEYVKDTQIKMEKGLPGYVNKTTGAKYKDPAQTAREWANKKYGTK